MKDPKNADEVEKSLNSVLSHNWSLKLAVNLLTKEVIYRFFHNFSITWPKITVNRPNSTICEIALNFELIEIFTSRIS